MSLPIDQALPHKTVSVEALRNMMQKGHKFPDDYLKTMVARANNGTLTGFKKPENTPPLTLEKMREVLTKLSEITNDPNSKLSKSLQKDIDAGLKITTRDKPKNIFSRIWHGLKNIFSLKKNARALRSQI